jgi:hypothetical protein
VSSRSGDTRWRATGTYVPTSLLKSALIDETRRFLLALQRTGDAAGTRKAMAAGELPQRSVYSRNTIAKTVKMRLLAWNPPTWVVDDLTAFAGDEHRPSLEAALLLHLARQDILLYDLVQHVVLPRWEGGERVVSRADVQRFLDLAEPEHPEVGRWSYATRQKLAGNVLTILRDFGLLRSATHGKGERQIVEPTVPADVAHHLVRLLRAEGLAAEDVPGHPDWRIWLWNRTQAANACASVGLSIGSTTEETG